ncbi:methyltransferase domain-containing protein [uncultured Tolumonas sp.]|uniref:class I SAM-dependent methyltransferase n=1 Tax=uncultured Tolumonas sp. TaxID=263765 RepID=UPI00292DEFB5|nr:methyltransferase domain-containing protein [uncultured Tolumonas sp.]
MRKVLNVGGNSKAILLPPQYNDFQHILLDIDPKGLPDIVCDARKLETLEPCQFDAIYCSHNLEHYYHHEVKKVLAGFLHVLKDDGFVQIRVPDISELMRITVEKNLDIDDILYKSSAGPIKVRDVLYGYSDEIEKSGLEYFAHKTGFTRKSLLKAINDAGFKKTYSLTKNIEIKMIAFKNTPSAKDLSLFNLPHE